MKNNYAWLLLLLVVSSTGCKKGKDATTVTPPVSEIFSISNLTINNSNANAILYNVSYNPSIKIVFTAPVKESTIAASISLRNGVTNISFNQVLQTGDNKLTYLPNLPNILKYMSDGQSYGKYIFTK